MNQMFLRPDYCDYRDDDPKIINSINSSIKTTRTPFNDISTKLVNSKTPYYHDIHGPFKKSRKFSDYKINPDLIPRPKHVDEIYRSSSNSNCYETLIESLPPFTTSYFSVKEIENSSPRFIRSSIINLPTDQDLLTKSSLLFGLNCHPFAEIQEGDNIIPEISVSDDILRCTRCNCYINNKFIFQTNKYGKRVSICNCCGYELDISNNNLSVKNDYFSSDLSHIIELTCPTVDIIAPKKFTSSVSFTPVYGIMIDISQLSIDLSFASYVNH